MNLSKNKAEFDYPEILQNVLESNSNRRGYFHSKFSVEELKSLKNTICKHEFVMLL